MHFLPFMTSLEFLTQQSAYTIYKIISFVHPNRGISIHLPLIPQMFHIFDTNDFKSCQNFHSSNLWNRGSWHWHMWICVELISLCHPFHILRELPCCFYFQTGSSCFFNGTNSTAKTQKSRTTNRADSVKISCWKVPLIYFSSIDDIAQWRYVMLSLSKTALKLVSY